MVLRNQTQIAILSFITLAVLPLHCAADETRKTNTALVIDNYDNETNRILIDFDINNPLGPDGKLHLQALKGISGPAKAARFNLRMPTDDRGIQFNLFASRNEYTIDGSASNFRPLGREDQLGAGLTFPLISEESHKLATHLELFRKDLRSEDSSIDFNELSHINLLRLKLTDFFMDSEYNVTTFNFSVNHGNFILDSDDARLAENAGRDAEGFFWVYKLKINHARRLLNAFKLQLSAQAQKASRNLSASEKMYLGGPFGVMSYPAGEAGGDEGLLLTMRLGHDIPFDIDGQLEAALLAQYGEVQFDHTDYAWSLDPNTTSMAGVGLGLTYRFSTRLTAQLDHVYRTGEIYEFTNTDSDHQTWFSLRITL
ncbi:ShlB/FhaC/HecB family hemolysin secretion/activation protein [Thiomicrorhabdus xiamenensis]|uniref:ShlB/FhaC/HecB family hemolysin secretion/activation protein n=1 Tax=Thiomicrorhabdus xiamenensis TaxID=2739063 RepID=A0A7D4NNN8_9GAMM|nr:ShlB/FhaC/HecB family hemolysin secretion/activation protein [Thiomicrorhabdus xiamenensis]QKI88893.1 ShlB/FhaC/HecB family hemolysin secretion/activation protein [Thiomicrorhabdus xiamenensis]